MIDLSKPEMKKTREGFGRALVDLGKADERIVVLVGDLTDSTMVSFFAEEFPDRFIQVGIAEQNMMTVAAGLSLVGKIPFLSTYGAFASCRSLDQVRVTLCYGQMNVKIGGAHGGISVGPDGATHQAMEEISIMRSMPNMQMVVPTDFHEARKATKAAAEVFGPVYIRFGRENVPVVTDEDTKFEWGKGATYREGGDLTIIACGVLVYEALVAHEELKKEGIEARVINMATIKPLDSEIILKAARETGAIVTAEEHQMYGGLGGAVAECTAKGFPVPVEMVAVDDRFGQSGKPDELMAAFGLKSKDIIARAHDVLRRKQGKAA
jgi:transketolase